MSWEETRGGVVGAARRTAHTDDAKDRTDEAHHTGYSPRGRARWLVPALVGGLVVLLLGGGATAAWMSSRGEGSAASTPTPTSAATPTATGAPSPTAPDAEPTSALPLEPTDQDVTYAGVVRCVEGGDFLVSQCPSVFPDTLICPAGLCTISFFVGPSLSGSPPTQDTVTVAFHAGDPAVEFRGMDKSGRCPGRLIIDGSRQGDGGYEIRIVNGARAGEADGSCSEPSDNVFEISLAPPP